VRRIRAGHDDLLRGLVGCRRHTTYTYDSNGNLATKTEGTDNWTYEWSARNELARVLKNNVEQARFSYDPMGRRAEKIAAGVTTSYTHPARSAGFHDPKVPTGSWY
jgi:YD repeat-containing protein